MLVFHIHMTRMDHVIAVWLETQRRQAVVLRFLEARGSGKAYWRGCLRNEQCDIHPSSGDG